MSEVKESNRWWRGSFPVWIVVLMLSALAYYYKHGEAEADAMRVTTSEEVKSLESRVTKLEVKLEMVASRLERIENKMDLVLEKVTSKPN